MTRAVLASAAFLLSAAAPMAQRLGPIVRNSMNGTAAVCVIANGQLREIEAELDTATGDTLIAGRPLAEAHPAPSPPYLAGAEWYARDEMVVFERRQYVRYGQPRVLRPDALTRVGEFRGVPLFAPSRTEAVRFVYALVGRNCEFQPYWYAATVGAVRGD